MIYPYNTAVRDAIWDTLKQRYPVPDDYKVRSMVLVSGGMDSVALLAGLLQHTQHEIHAHHVEIHNLEGRADIEKAALNRCLDYMRQHYRPFTFTTTRYEMMTGEKRYVGPDSSVVMFMASRVNISMGSCHDLFWTGHLRGPMFEYVNAGAVMAASHSFLRQQPVWMMPFINFLKYNLYASVPPELAELTWSCRGTRHDAAGKPLECGTCHACIAWGRVRKAIEHNSRLPQGAASLPAKPIDPLATEEAAAVAWPCLFPRHDDARNYFRCGICENCELLKTFGFS